MGRLVLGVPVGRHLIRAWRDWLAPAVQPFFVDDRSDWPECQPRSSTLSAELRDTYKFWRLPKTCDVVWLDEPAFMSLDRGRRRALVRSQVVLRRGAVPTVRRWADLLDGRLLRDQADGHRFVWWPSLVARSPERILERFVQDEGDQTTHQRLPPSRWRRCADVLPGARGLAGTFAAGSGPNCFGTVMAAAGVTGAADRWMQQAPFNEWLGAACIPGGDDNEPGTVLVWRDRPGTPAHAAVTVGDGYALEKPAQTWWTPRLIATVGDVKRAARASGLRLERHTIVRSRR